MNKAYSKINWRNSPSTNTPINETNLGSMDSALDTIDNRVVSLDTTKLDKSTANTMVKNVSYNEDNGVFTITYLNGTTATLDTKLEKLAVNFSYDAENERLVITLSDGTIQYVDLKALITEYNFQDSTAISFTVTDGKVSASLIDGSVTASKLQPNFLADCNTAKNGAETAASNASTSSTTATEKALVSEGYANGTQNGTEVGESSPYYHNNARYWKEEAKAIAGGGVTSFNGRSGSVTPQSGDYSLDMISGGEQIDTNLAELQILGWKAPYISDSCHNYVQSDVLHQKIGRVELGSLSWTKVEGTFKTTVSDIKFVAQIGYKVPSYCTKYTQHAYDYSSNMENNSYMIGNNSALIIKDTSYTTIEDFANANKGVYLYYELATEKTYNIPNSIGIAEDCDNLQFVGYTIPKEMPIHNYKDSEGSFHKRVGRVRLAELNWFTTTISDKTFFYSGDLRNKGVTNHIYSSEYKTVTSFTTIENKIIRYTSGDQLYIYDSTYTTADTFKSHLDSVNAYLYYELATEEVIKCGGEQTRKADDVEFLGYEIPSACPVQNYKDSNGDYHQKVGRVDLGSMSWEYVSGFSAFRTMDITNAKSHALNRLELQYNTKGYVSVGYMKVDQTDKSITINSTSHTANTTYIKDTAYTDATAFKTAMSGKYLYYELATEVVIKCGREKINTLSDTYKTKAESANVVISSTAPSDTTALWVVP